MLLEWWNGIVRWATSDAGRALITTAILPFVAIVVGGVVAGLIARGSVKRLITQRDREHKAAAVAALLSAARRAAHWNTLSAPEKDHVEHQVTEAEVRMRLLPMTGSGVAADWAAHRLATMKTNSANYAFQADQDLADLQDGLIAWQSKPSRARKLFAQDLAGWKYETPSAADILATRQHEWSAAQTKEPVTAASSAL